MTEELARRIGKEAEQRRNAFMMLKTTLRMAGVPVESMKVVETSYGDRIVACVLESGAQYNANITGDSVPMAIWDTLKQIPALRERG